MTTFTFDEDTFSDLFKEAHGFRPRHSRFFDPECTDEEKQEIWEFTLEQLEETNKMLDDMEVKADKDFEDRIESAMLAGADDRKTAIRWIFQADGVTLFDIVYGFSSIQYEFGITDKFKIEIEALLEDETFLRRL